MPCTSSQPTFGGLSFPAWDSVPYDRVAPNAEIVAQRVSTLAELAGRDRARTARPLIVLTTINAVLQRVPPHDYFAASMQRLAPGNVVSMASLIERLESLGYGRAGTVTDPGQYAVRGGILDLYPPGGSPDPPRLLRRHAGIRPRLRSRDATNSGAPRRA